MSLTRIVAPNRLVEANVISPALLETALREEREWEEDYIPTITWEPIDATKATTLVLSYSRLAQISNLTAMRALRTLRLDNNAIERIEGLETLVCLQKLDLSFNSITAIEGLGTLTQLEELTLFGNKITAIGGLEGQRHCLQVLSLGKNAIADVRQLSYLRGFPSLRLLGTEGNFRPAAGGSSAAVGPVDDASYRASVLAQLPRLAYLDWCMVTPPEREAATEMHKRLLQCEAQAAVDSVDGSQSLSATMTHPADAGDAAGVFDARATARRTTDAVSLASVDTSAARDAGLLDVALLWRLLTTPEAVTEIPAAAPPPASPGGKSVAGAAAIGAAPSQGDIDAVFRVPSITSRVGTLHEAVGVTVEGTMSRGLALQSQSTGEEAAAVAVLEAQMAASDHESRRRIDAFETLKKHTLRELAVADEALSAAIAAKHAARRSMYAAATPTAAGGRDSPSKRLLLRARSSTVSSLGGDHGDGGGMGTRQVEAAQAAVARLEELKHEAVVLATRLIAMETVLHEQCVAVISEFESAFGEVGAKRVDLVHKFFRSVEHDIGACAEDCRALVQQEADSFHDLLAAATSSSVLSSARSAADDHATPGAGAATARTTASADRAAASSAVGLHSGGAFSDPRPLPVGYDEEVAALLGDKDGALTVVTAAFEQRMTRMLAAEDRARRAEKERATTCVRRKYAEESTRHRERVAEINSLQDALVQGIGALVAEEKTKLEDLAE